MRTHRTSKDERAEVGVGTLIVFIAMVLVAAVAAAVIVNVTGGLQGRALSTGNLATQEVSSNLKVLNVFGDRPDATSDIDDLTINVGLSAGSLPVDLEPLILRYSDGTNTVVNYVWEAYDGTPSTDLVFQANWVRGAGTGLAGASAMETGDLVEIHFTLANALAERSTVSVSLVPEIGTATIADFETPASYGTDTLVTLR